MAITIDTTPAIDHSLAAGKENTAYNTKLGSGPAIYVFDGRVVYDRDLIKIFRGVGDELAIPYQIRQPGGGTTNASAIQGSLSGIPTIAVSVPHRYPHSPVSISRIDDWSNTIYLLDAVLKKITPSLFVDH